MNSLRLIPAIDLRGGKVVRLIRGDYDKEIVYGADPCAFARRFEEEGAEWLHVVDLEGALAGQCRNLNLVKQIRDTTRLKIEFGGGLRTKAAIEGVIDLGVDRAVIGTKALDAAFISETLAGFGDRIAIGVDVKQGFVQTSGWTRGSEQTVASFVEFLNHCGAKHLIWTNIVRDGMLQGPDLAGLNDVLKMAGRLQVILSGGVSSLDDVRKLVAVRHANFSGFIVGRALYEGKMTVREALQEMNTI
jgi:phosphoribosylformimino-5-aminoimidazole carboxamide ribotide isomerase